MGGWNLDDIRVLAGDRYAPGRVSISWAAPGRFTLTEGESAGRSYLLKLDQDPGPTPVTVSLTASRGTGELTFPPSVVIDSSNWFTGKSITLSAPDNNLVDGLRPVTVKHTLTSANPHFSGLIGPSLGVAILDDDEPIIRSQPPDRTLPRGTDTSIGITTWPVSGGLSYQWFSGESGDTSRPLNGATGTSLNVTVGSFTGRYWVRVRRTLNASTSFFEFSDTALVSPLTGYAEWKHALLSHGYSQAELDAPDFDSGDPDADGLTRLAEYALGGQPYSRDESLLPRVVVTGTGAYFHFRRARSDVDYTVALTADLQTWSDFVTNPGTVSAAADQIVPLPDSGISPVFARLRVDR
jgi:hypothetical protein